jgi:hypothetical protein
VFGPGFLKGAVVGAHIGPVLAVAGFTFHLFRRKHQKK